ncbi:hypothetical protein L6Q96_01640 [Candidatus Binatia bacterium]|nr:hypothetical protein [Candidatus Binatia bacterium]
MRALVRMLVVLAGLVGPAVAYGQVGLKPGVPIGVLLEGYLGQGPAGVVPVVRWTIEAQRKTYTFTATKLEVRTGNTSYMDIINALDGYPVNLTFFGEQLGRVIAAGPDTRLSIIGNIQTGGGARYLIISSVTAESASTPAAGKGS